MVGVCGLCIAGSGRLLWDSLRACLPGVRGESGAAPANGARWARGDDEPHGEAAAGSSAIAAE